MLIVKFSRNFKKSFKHVSGNKHFKQETFEYIVVILASRLELPEKYKDHALQGKHKDKRECHLAPDLLLVYSIEENILTLNLLDIGNHNALFGN